MSNLNLFNSWTLKAEIKTVVTERPNLWMAAIVANADYWYFSLFDKLNQFLRTGSKKNNLQVFVP